MITCLSSLLLLGIILNDRVRLLLVVNSGSLIFEIVATELVVNNPVLFLHYTGGFEVIIASIKDSSDE